MPGIRGLQNSGIYRESCQLPYTGPGRLPATISLYHRKIIKRLCKILLSIKYLCKVSCDPSGCRTTADDFHGACLEAAWNFTAAPSPACNCLQKIMIPFYSKTCDASSCNRILGNVVLSFPCNGDCGRGGVGAIPN